MSGLGYFGCLKFFGALDYIAPFSPTIAAFILTYTSEGFRWGEKRGIDFSFGKLWLIPHILINANYWIVTPFSNSVVNQPLKCGGGLVSAIGYYPSIFFSLAGRWLRNLVGRGYAIDRLQAKYNDWDVDYGICSCSL
ncbi:MAG TPA: hypothetical protein GXX32_02300 [Methanothermobacter sp.]|nr:hypothetical protein [Methanothermobacter sp.]